MSVVVVWLSAEAESEVVVEGERPKYAHEMGSVDGVPCYYAYRSKTKLENPFMMAMGLLARWMWRKNLKQESFSPADRKRKRKPKKPEKNAYGATQDKLL